VDKFLDAYNYSKLNQEDTKKLNCPIARNEIERVRKILSTKEVLRT
jgi:hypothetical protein